MSKNELEKEETYYQIEGFIRRFKTIKDVRKYIKENIQMFLEANRRHPSLSKLQEAQIYKIEYKKTFVKEIIS